MCWQFNETLRLFQRKEFMNIHISFKIYQFFGKLETDSLQILDSNHRMLS